jgi:hypothetical protein
VCQRLFDKGAENEVINLERQWQCMIDAGDKALPGVFFEKVTDDDWEQCRLMDRRELCAPLLVKPRAGSLDFPKADHALIM